MEGLAKLGKRLRREGEKVLAEKEPTLSKEEMDQVKAIISRKPETAPLVSMKEVALLERLGLEGLSQGIRFEQASGDPSFRSIARKVWDRSPNSRDVELLAGLAARWGTYDGVNRTGISELIETWEARERRLSPAERDTLREFTGDEYLSSSP
jgi:hypothetical protein